MSYFKQPLCYGLPTDRFFDRIESTPEPLRLFDPEICDLANKGRIFQRRLQDWHKQTIAHENSSDVHTKLALAVHHALRLFICMNYMFYTFWDDESIPKLTSSEMETHISAIVDHAGDIIERSDIPGLMLLFPLRIAGANTGESLHKRRILQLLDRVSQKGFVVSNRITVDLQEVWAYKAAQSMET